MTKSIDDVLAEFGFRSMQDVQRRNSISDLVSNKEQTGIYVIEFENDQIYVGKSLRISRRFGEHKRRFQDIKRISWRPFPKKELDQFERSIIAKVEGAGFLTRNISFAATPIGECDLDELISPDQQAAWLSSNEAFGDFGDRPDIPDARHKTAARFEELRAGQNGEDNAAFLLELAVLRLFIGACIPFPGKTEYSFWSISILPPIYKGFQTYYRINTRNQEVFTLGYYEDNSISCHLMAKKSTIIQYMSNNSFLSMLVSCSPYTAAGNDQIQIQFLSIEHAIRSLMEPEIRRACKEIILPMMRKGGDMYASSHCFQIVDKLTNTRMPRAVDENGYLLDPISGNATRELCDPDLTPYELATWEAPPPEAAADEAIGDRAS